MIQQNYYSKVGAFTITVLDHTKHLGGKTPAQAARMNVPNNWKGLIDRSNKTRSPNLSQRNQHQRSNNQTVKQLEVKV